MADNAKLSVKQIGEFFRMSPKEMIREWKSLPDNPTDEQRKTMLTADEKEAIRNGLENGTLTY